MSAWDHLIESRIRDWQERQRRGEAQVAQHRESQPIPSLETQLFEDIVGLYRAARKETDFERRRDLMKDAEQLRIRLAVLLEKHKMPLVAKELEARLAAELDSAE